MSKRILRKLLPQLYFEGVLKKALVKAMLPWGGEGNSGQTKIFANGAEQRVFILFLMVRISIILHLKQFDE